MQKIEQDGGGNVLGQGFPKPDSPDPANDVLGGVPSGRTRDDLLAVSGPVDQMYDDPHDAPGA